MIQQTIRKDICCGKLQPISILFSLGRLNIYQLMYATTIHVVLTPTQTIHYDWFELEISGHENIQGQRIKKKKKKKKGIRKKLEIHEKHTQKKKKTIIRYYICIVCLSNFRTLVISYEICSILSAWYQTLTCNGYDTLITWQWQISI